MNTEIIYEFTSLGCGKCRACKCDVNWGQLPDHDESIEHKDNILKMVNCRIDFVAKQRDFNIHRIESLNKYRNNIINDKHLNTEGWGGVPAQFY